MANDWSVVSENIPTKWRDLRDDYREIGSEGHARIAGELAYLEVGLEMGLTYALAIDAIDQEEYNRIFSEGKAALKEVAEQQAKYAKDEKPSVRFLTIIATLLQQQKISLADKSDATKGVGGPPRTAEQIGWCDDGHIHLIPGAAYNAVSRYSSRENHHFSISENSLRKELKEEGYLISTNDRTSNTVKVYGKARKVLTIRFDTLNQFVLQDYETTEDGTKVDGVFPEWEGKPDDDQVEY